MNLFGLLFVQIFITNALPTSFEMDLDPEAGFANGSLMDVHQFFFFEPGLKVLERYKFAVRNFYLLPTSRFGMPMLCNRLMLTRGTHLFFLLENQL